MTDRDKKKFYTARQVKSAELAREYQRKLDYASPGCDPYTRTGGTGTGVRSDRIEDDPIHTIHCHDTCCVYL